MVCCSVKQTVASVKAATGLFKVGEKDRNVQRHTLSIYVQRSFASHVAHTAPHANFTRGNRVVIGRSFAHFDPMFWAFGSWEHV